MLRVPYPYDQAAADQFLDIVEHTTEQHGHPIHFAVRNPQDKLVGGMSFEGLACGHRAEIGYWLAKPYWGRGIMTDVVGKACEFAFRQWTLVRITAHVFAFNTASARVLEKNGFQREGLLRKHFQKDDAFIDSYLYALVR